MVLKQCFEVHNLVVIKLNSTNLGQMTNLNVVFQILVSIKKFDTIYTST